MKRHDTGHFLSIGSQQGYVNYHGLSPSLMPVFDSLSTRSDHDAQEDPAWESGSNTDSEPEEEYLDFDCEAIDEDIGTVAQAVGPYGRKRNAPDDEVVVVEDDSDSDADAMSE
jgi:hypothetical protein